MSNASGNGSTMLTASRPPYGASKRAHAASLANHPSRGTHGSDRPVPPPPLLLPPLGPGSERVAASAVALAARNKASRVRSAVVGNAASPSDETKPYVSSS